MKKPLLAIVGLAAAAILAVPVAAGAQGPNEDSVVGTAVVELGDSCDPRTFTFDAHSGPSGENPRGTVTVQLACVPQQPLTLTLPVACLNVVGNSATVGGEVEQFLAPLFVEDNDSTDPDRFLLGGPLPLGDPCPAGPGAGLDLRPILSGNIIVTDAQPFPTTKDQCKNGGWRNYPSFKNQGQCVAFVQRGPKP